MYMYNYSVVHFKNTSFELYDKKKENRREFQGTRYSNILHLDYLIYWKECKYAYVCSQLIIYLRVPNQGIAIL